VPPPPPLLPPPTPPPPSPPRPSPPPPCPSQPPWTPAYEFKDTTWTDTEDGNPEKQFYSYWVEIQVLVPTTTSHLEDHNDAEQGVSTFETTFSPPSPSTPVTPHKDVGALKTPINPNEADGGGAVPLPPGEGGRNPSTTTPNLLYTPGTNTVWEYDEDADEWNPVEGIDELVNPSDTFYNGEDPYPQLPENVNRVVEIPDVNGDGYKDLAIVTENGVYLMLTEDGNNHYSPPKLLSDEAGNVKDVTALKYDPGDSVDIVVVTDDQTPNRVYLGDPEDPEFKNLGVEEHLTGTTVNGVDGEKVGGLRHEYLEDPTQSPGDFKDSSRVLPLDTDGVDGPDSFVVTNLDDQDELYLKFTSTDQLLTPVKLGDGPGDPNADTYDVDAARLDPNNPNAPLTIIFAKEGVDKYLELPKRDATTDPYDALTPPIGGIPTLQDLDATDTTITHSVKFQTVPSGVYGTGDLERAHLYVGKEQTTSTDKLGVYYHNPGTPGVTLGTMKLTPNNIDAGLTSANGAPDLLGTTMEVTVLKKDQPPSVIFGTSGGTQIVITQHDPAGSAPFTTIDYDGDGANSDHKVKILSPDATASDLDKAGTKDQLRDLESANGIVRSADLNGDGYPDMVTGVYTVLSKAGRYDDGTEEKHTPQRFWNGPMPRDVIAYDYDKDGDVDLVVLTVEGEVVLLPNDGSGIFSRLTQERKKATTSAIAGLDTVEDTREKAPRMIALIDGNIAVATATGIQRLAYNPSTRTLSNNPASPYTTNGAVLDMKHIHLTGQPGANRDIVVLYADGSVMVHRDGQFGAPTLIGTYPSAVRLGVGNVMGDSPSRKYDQPRDSPVTIQAQTGNSGQVLDPNSVDPRSLDVVVVKNDGSVHLIEGHYDATKGGVTGGMVAHPAALKDRATGNAFAFSSTREITSVDVHDMDGDGLADIVLAYKDDTDAVYRSIIYISTDVPKPGGLTTANPTEDPVLDLKLEEKVLSPTSGGAEYDTAGAPQADTASTRRVLIVDQDLDGNSDIVYASDENGPARVTYARPPGDATIKTSETVDPAIVAGMMKWIDQALIDAYNDANGAHHTGQGHTASGTQNPSDPATLCAAGVLDGDCRPAPGRGQINHKGTDVSLTEIPSYYHDDTHPEAYKFKLTNGEEPVQTLPDTDPLYVPEVWMDKTGDTQQVANSAAANHPGGSRGSCRAPGEPVVPVTVSFQLDFPTIPCPRAKMPDCILPEPISASKKLIPLAGGGTAPICATTIPKVWHLAHKRNPSPPPSPPPPSPPPSPQPAPGRLLPHQRDQQHPGGRHLCQRVL
jgi:hypothetical protein